MELGIKNKFALVCASSKGLGFSVVESLLEEGCNVLMTSRNLAVSYTHLTLPTKA